MTLYTGLALCDECTTWLCTGLEIDHSYSMQNQSKPEVVHMPKYVINNTVLKEVLEIKDLDVYHNTLLLFDKHVSEKAKKLTRC